MQTLHYIVLDLETTGLDPRRDQIIEIGMIKCHGQTIVDTLNTLINPGRPIPEFITSITGITDADVKRAPKIATLVKRIQNFIGDLPVLGQNISFDTGFLENNGVSILGDHLDTFDVASVVIPNAPRYNLTSLVYQLGLQPYQSHRALDDAQMTKDVWWALYERAHQMPVEVVAELVRLGKTTMWGGAIFFEHLLEELQGDLLLGAHPQPDPYAHFRRLAPVAGDPLPKKEHLTPLPLADLTAMLSPGGLFAHKFPGFESREPQVAVMRAIAESFNDGKHLMVEAGTGTGKSVAYLLPAIHWALQNGRRVLVSTNTINLQDQLVNKDLPMLREVTGLPFNIALMKGKSNYICPRRVGLALKRGPRNGPELRVLGKILHWLTFTDTGDKGEITLTGGPEQAVWAQLNADDIGCGGERCLMLGGVCPYHRNRAAGQGAHVVVVNHALFMADIAANNHILPEADYVIIDEAHHLESAATDGLSDQIGFESVAVALSGLNAAVPKTAKADYKAAAIRVVAERDTTLDAAKHFFSALLDLGLAANTSDNAYRAQLRLTDKVRAREDWAAVMHTAEQLLTLLRPMVADLKRMVEAMADLISGDPDDDDAASGLATARKTLTDLADHIEELVQKPRADRIYYLEFSANGGYQYLTVTLAPLNVGPLLAEHLWQKKESVILTSATLTTAGDFGYITSRLSATAANTLSVPSPFDYAHNTLFYVVNDAPEPTRDKSGHQKALEQGLIDLAAAVEARMLVLFTSHSQLQQTADAIRGPLRKHNVEVLQQSTGGSRGQLVETFRNSPRAMLLGTRSFWEGVDLPGEQVEIVVIAKLPFDVPTDPIFAARSETFENSFDQYSVPEAILRFRQGFGRLIRTGRDFGAVVVFDPRLLTKGYGQRFLDSLPPTHRRKGPLSALPAAITRWFEHHRGAGR